MAGQHGMWQKQCFYEPSVKVPMIIRLPSGETGCIQQNVSLVDVLPTLLDIVGIENPPDLPGESLLKIARNQSNELTRTVFSEYHAMGMMNAGFMLKNGEYKLCYYVGNQPQIFNVENDPMENNDLTSNPEYTEIRSNLESSLHEIVNPEFIDYRAKENQRIRRLEHK